MSARRKIAVLNSTNDKREEMHEHCLKLVSSMILSVSEKIKDDVLFLADLTSEESEELSTFLAIKYVRTAIDSILD